MANLPSQFGESIPIMVARLMPFTITACGLSDIGLVRQNNEDVWAEVPHLHFFLLADGMGGHQAGEIAAKETVKILSKVIDKKLKTSNQPLSVLEMEELLRKAIRHVNTLIFKMGRENLELRGMGTTLCTLFFHQEGVIFAHVGDSRIYRCRQGVMEQVTKDHSLLCELVDQGQINEQQASEFLYKNIITKAIGTEPKVEPSLGVAEVQAGDLFLMCSDGLSDLVSLEEIEAEICSKSSLQKKAKRLIALANEKGGRDNITVVLVKVEGKNDEKDLSR